MASRINDDVRAEWDSIDLQYNGTKISKASSGFSKSANEDRNIKGNAKQSSPSRQKTSKSPKRKLLLKRSSISQDHTGLTQDCITLDPGPPLHSPYIWLRQSSRDDILKSPTATNGENTTTAEQAGLDLDFDTSDEKSDGIVKASGQVPIQSIDETQQSLTDSDESDIEYPLLDAPTGIQLPIDSDDEDFKTAKEKRVRAYAKNGLLSNTQSPSPKERQQKQSSVNDLQNDTINLASSGLPSTSSSIRESRQSPMLPPPQARQLSYSPKKKGLPPLKGYQIPIPVSSSPEAPQNSPPSKSEVIQVQSNPAQDKIGDVSAVEEKMTSISYPSLQLAISSTTNNKMEPSAEQDYNAIVPYGPAKLASAPTASTATSSRKHPRSSVEPSGGPNINARKRIRIRSPIAILPKPPSMGQTLPVGIMAAPSPDPRLSRAHNVTPRYSNPQASFQPMPSNVTNTNSSATNKPAEPINNIPRKLAPYVSGQAPPFYADVVYNYALPQISASQPVPERPKIYQAAQATTVEPLPQTKTPSADLAPQAVVANQEALELSTPSIPKPIELDFEPLTKILDLQGADYCTAIQNNRIYSGLQSLFCEFLATHLAYLGNMEHLFNLCIWLLRSAINPQQQDRINEEFWDDFILQHQQGKYNDYVQYCLTKFRQPGSWTTWYEQAQKLKPTSNVVTVARLQSILSGKEFTAPKRQIPLLWSRFLGKNRGGATKNA